MSSSYTIPPGKILERLRFENPWWQPGKDIAPNIGALQPRLYFDLFYPLVKDLSLKRAIILMGPRRVGKTVMMQHTIHRLLQEGAPARKILFVGIDNPLYINMGLEELYHKAKLAAGNAGNYEEDYVFFDEIQYLKDWERHLKVLVDSYPQTKFIVSGSAAAALRMKSTESGAGRFHDFMLPPLTFQEFLHLQDLQDQLIPSVFHYLDKEVPFYKALDVKELNKAFLDYLNYGGYPEVIFSETVKRNMQSYIKSDIIDKVLLRDLPGLYGIKDVQDLNRFFVYLSYNTGKQFSWQKMSKESGVPIVELKKYIEYLESAFLIKMINKVDDHSGKFKRITGFKIYLTNPSLRTALFSPISATDDEMGNMVETSIYAQWLHREQDRLFYAKWKKGRKEGEVDMVHLDEKYMTAKWAVEIKWSNRYVERPHELESLLHFCQLNKLSTAIVTTIDKEKKVAHQGVELHYIPASVYAYVIGSRTLDIKGSWYDLR